MITETIREQDIAARVGGDEFCILFLDCPHDETLSLCEKIRKRVEDFSFKYQDNDISITVSMGLVAISTGRISVSQLLKDADIMCYRAKERGRNIIEKKSYSEENDDHSADIHWQSFIKNTLTQENLLIALQPIKPIDEKNQSKTACEVLARIYETDNKLIKSADFITNAEKYNFIKKVDFYVIEKIFEHINKNSLYTEYEFISINISGQTIGSDDFINEVSDLFHKYFIPYNLICFEITETAAITNLTTCINTIKELKINSVKFALDDFGSGLSSFNYLEMLDVDFIKIDGNLVKGIDKNKTKMVVVEAINNIAKSMNKKTVAEHVENKEMQDLLIKIGVDYIQGYYPGKPVILNKPIKK